MGATKTELYGESLIELAALAKALGHPARIAILGHLMHIEECIGGELVNEIGLSQPTISQHLTVLKNQGLISWTVKGAGIYYCINQDQWNEMKNKLMEFLNKNVNIP